MNVFVKEDGFPTDKVGGIRLIFFFSFAIIQEY